jgi:hypothetical protein
VITGGGPSSSSSLEADSRSDLSSSLSSVLIAGTEVDVVIVELPNAAGGGGRVAIEDTSCSDSSFPPISILLNESTSIAGFPALFLLVAAVVAALQSTAPPTLCFCSFLWLYLLSIVSKVFANGLKVPPLVYIPAASLALFLLVLSSVL